MILLKNKKVKFHYEIIEKYTAGISLFGFEVKSLKNKRGSFDGSYILIKIKNNNINKKEVILRKFFIPSYQKKNTPENYNPYRDRSLLLQKKEIVQLEKKMKKQRLTIIPLSFFLKKNLIKLEIALVKGKKEYDKKESIKKSDESRRLARDYKIKIK